jgi:uncharacterized protein YjiS (DUF1127 family)
MLHNLKRRIVEWQRTRRAITRLRLFDDRLLADMGIKREDIAARVAGDCDG